MAMMSDFSIDFYVSMRQSDADIGRDVIAFFEPLRAFNLANPDNQLRYFTRVSFSYIEIPFMGINEFRWHPPIAYFFTELPIFYGPVSNRMGITIPGYSLRMDRVFRGWQHDVASYTAWSSPSYNATFGINFDHWFDRGVIGVGTGGAMVAIPSDIQSQLANHAFGFNLWSPTVERTLTLPHMSARTETFERTVGVPAITQETGIHISDFNVDLARTFIPAIAFELVTPVYAPSDLDWLDNEVLEGILARLLALEDGQEFTQMVIGQTLPRIGTVEGLVDNILERLIDIDNWGTEMARDLATALHIANHNFMHIEDILGQLYDIDNINADFANYLQQIIARQISADTLNREWIQNLEHQHQMTMDRLGDIASSLEQTGSLDLDGLVGDGLFNFNMFMHFDITNTFPFSLPWDFMHILNQLRLATSNEGPPVFVLDFSDVIAGAQMTFDFTPLEGFARVFRVFQQMLFTMVLLFLTGRFMK